LREHGLEPDVEAARHDIDGVVAALLDDAARVADCRDAFSDLGTRGTEHDHVR